MTAADEESGGSRRQRWYAVQAKPRQDARAETHLRNQGYEVFRPLIRVRKRRAGGMQQVVESMFPRYLFVRLCDLTENWAPIRSTRGVAGLVRWGDHVPTVPEGVIADLRGRMSDDGCVDLTGEADFRPNEKVRITEGVFAGYEGLYQARSGEERVVVLLEIMQQAQTLTLPATAISRD
ncbi:MAG: transcription/translation regulatory transformer protein RfaH [Ectothiorhodospiraceae bacterium]|nr:transcription/translation regulatory transformer protein RfaH [Ectothiorhodospiraceae bacterium]